MKKKVMPVIIIIALILIIGLIYGAQIAIEKFSYSKTQADLNEYYGISSEQDVAIIYNDSVLEDKAVKKDGVYYLDYNLAKSVQGNKFYYGEADQTLFYTTPSATYTTKIGESSWTSTNGESGDAGYTISYVDGEKLYIALGYLKAFTDLDYQVFASPDRIRLYAGSYEQTLAKVKKKTAVRVLGGIKSDVVSYVEGGMAVVTNQMDEWSEIITWDAHKGYVENKYLDFMGTGEVTKAAIEAENPEGLAESPIETAAGSLPAPAGLKDYTTVRLDGKVNIGFHPIAGAAGNATIDGVIAPTKSLNVLAPTWFTISDNEGTVVSYATRDYVSTAHANGMQVWGVLDNFNSGNQIDTVAILSHEASRANVISQLIAYAQEYEIDGINADLEQINESCGPDYLQFMRELSVACRQNGLVFSIDDYVPMDFNDHYDLVEQGEIADYVVIMGYDEHYGGSDEAGSVASIGYVQGGIEKALTMVPAEKLVNAIPFYTRVWTTSGGEVSSKALHMDGATNIINQYGMEMNWDEETCQYYGEVTDSNGALIQLWNEESRSIEVKLSVMQAAGIAGVAEWALGFENAEVWDVIAAYMAQ
ncbi:glycosyl hydrolase family 18 protein [Butyrivibrio sp. AE3006]|uniref:glycosyl hydrolase family 18 protein n=1 Tax=Butyrivibrio sp. AE3006 TaxID=1280673 RepID=UPI0003FDCE73|nr:glycosyl hydrolase family 18 protein [Butyrivibrio sp. AE3006]